MNIERIKQILLQNREIHIENKIFSLRIKYTLRYIGLWIIIIIALTITCCYLFWLLGIEIYS